jgi:hypothetical protein
VNWTGAGVVTDNDVVSMAIQPNGDILALSRGGSVWKSADDGATFTGIAAVTLGNDGAAMTIDPPSGDVFVLGAAGEVVRSTTDGVSFNAVGVITTPDATALMARQGSLYALTATGAVAKSDDDGSNWMFVGTFSQVRATAMTTDGSSLVAATAEGLVAASNDATAWTFVGTVNQIHVVALGNDIPTVTSVGDRAPAAAFALTRVYPNPAGRGDALTVDFLLERDDVVTLELYGVDGRLVAKRETERFSRGAQRATWSLPRGSAGVYFLRAITGSGTIAHARIVRVH